MLIYFSPIYYFKSRKLLARAKSARSYLPTVTQSLVNLGYLPVFGFGFLELLENAPLALPNDLFNLLFLLFDFYLGGLVVEGSELSNKFEMGRL